ncbi:MULTISPECIES: hypothetical protein [Cupriavidus]|uniref:hypothetical protein n=1 Tax=Cupriavidus TaxID=106589 RepID=UPI00140FD939|nr:MULTISPECIES: hypothetical protein [Cupriavidus]QYY34164.1 hypothetical protein K2O51_32925 [Cupriavidus pinatubonensis]
MSIKSIVSVAAQAQVTLERWRVRETAGGERYFVGFCVETRAGRVSTAIRTFDATTGVGTTSSGRRYLLSGWPCFDADAERIWDRLAELHAITEIKDVSVEYMLALPK